jgi:hypothetical protein
MARSNCAPCTRPAHLEEDAGVAAFEDYQGMTGIT